MRRHDASHRLHLMHRQWTAGGALSVGVLLAAGVLSGSEALAQAAAPRVAVDALPVKAAKGWQQVGSATYDRIGNAAQVTTKSPATILNWNSFDIGRDARLHFNLPSGTARVLNKVQSGANLGLSTIEGSLSSNGQVYIYNPNGVVFGTSARVNVGSLVASTLKLDDQRFLDGLLSPSFNPTFAVDPALGRTPGKVVVEGERLAGVLQQASIQASRNGLVMMVAPQVLNQGALSAPDGQVVLAAGTKVYLAAPASADMRGLRVEVSSEGLENTATRALAANQALGRIDVQRGNATLAGMSVNQSGLISASTSVSLNGSVYLKATDGARKDDARAAAYSTQGGELTLGEGSRITVLPTLSDTATAPKPPAGPEFKPSEVLLTGRTIDLQSDASILAPGGKVTATAAVKLREEAQAPNDALIRLRPGSVIDVSGSKDVLLAMESNVIEAELRGGELADNVLLRNSPVRGGKVRLDARKIGNGIAVANVLGYTALRPFGVGEFTATGGTVQLKSEGSVRLEAGSRIDVSGGSTRYLDGHVNTTKLTLGGRLYDIETASAALPYDGLRHLADSSVNFEKGYVTGAAAGTVAVDAATITLDGQLQGQTVQGPRQREVGASQPAGAVLKLGNVAQVMDGTGVLSGSASPQNVGLQSRLLLGAPVGGTAVEADALVLDVERLVGQGFTGFQIVSASDIVQQRDLSLRAGSFMWLGTTGHLRLGSALSAPSGQLVLTAQQSLSIAADSRIDLAGRWTNDQPMARPTRDAEGNPVGDVALTGGRLRARARDLDVGDRSSIDVSGGAWLDVSGRVRQGQGGSVTLQASPFQTPLDATLRLGDDVALRGFSSATGGTLSLQGRHVRLGLQADDLAAWRELGNLGLTADFFTQGGFTNRSLTANGSLDVVDGAQLLPRAASWVLATDAGARPSGRMDAVASTTLLPLSGQAGSRVSSSLTLAANGHQVAGDGLGVVRVGRDAGLFLDPGARLTLQANHRIAVDGTLSTPGGVMNLLLTDDPRTSSVTQFDATRAIWLSGSSRLLARGSTDRLRLDASGYLVGDILDGGSIRLGRIDGGMLVAGNGTVVAEAGSVMDVSGASIGGVSLRSGSVTQTDQTLASAAGSVEIRAREGVFLGGSLKAAGGGVSALGGTLSVALDREDFEGGASHPRQDRVLSVEAAAAASLVPAGWREGQALTGQEGRGRVSTGMIDAAGLATLELKSQNRIELEGSVKVQAAAEVRLDAPVLAARGVATVQAPHVVLGNADVRYQQPQAAVSGAGTLTVQATHVDLVGRSATVGAGQVVIRAREDIRLQGVQNLDAFGLSGALDTGRSLTLDARRIYPGTLSDFNIRLHGASSLLNIVGQGESVMAPLSAAGRLSFTADCIVQGGRLYAPFGQILLQAGSELRLQAGSVTSVAGQGVVPLGTVVNGADWSYEIGGRAVVWKNAPSADPERGEARLPSKKIDIKAASVVQESGAVLDLSGGGKLYAYEFTPGPGGSGDVLAAVGGARNQVFAISPTFRDSTAPVDAQYGQDGLRHGDQVYLSGGPGLPAGLYTLLPAHYALQPGAFLIEPLAGSKDMSAALNRPNADGSVQMAGYRQSSLDGSRDARWSGYVVSTADLVRKRSEFRDFDADTFFRQQAATLQVPAMATPGDAGRLSLQVERQLALQGETRLQALQGRAGDVDIAASRVQIVSRRDQDVGTDVRLVADDLVAMKAGSLLVGGLRSTEADGGVRIDVKADRVLVANSGAHPLSGRDVLLTARDEVRLGSRAVVESTGTSSAQDAPLRVAGDGALLRLSQSGGSLTERTGTVQTAGRLTLDDGATIRTGRSVTLDATAAMQLPSVLDLPRGGELYLSAPSMQIGGERNAGVTGLWLDRGLLAGFDRLGSLGLFSYGDIDFKGVVALGGASTAELSLGARTLRSQGADVSVTAARVTLQGPEQSGMRARAATAPGRLQVRATEVRLAPGEVQLQGFTDTAIEASGRVLAEGASALITEGDLSVSSAALLTGRRAEVRLVAGGDLTLKGSSRPSGDVDRTGTALGGAIGLQGRRVVSSARIEARGGQVDIHAREGIELTGGEVSVAGVTAAFGSGASAAPAGTVSLSTERGAVVLGESASLDLSAQGADAGTLRVSATGDGGSLTLQGRLQAAASAAQDPSKAQGRFFLDVRTLADAQAFARLNATLDAAGFNELRDVRVRAGDLTLSAGAGIRARDVRLSVDDGNLTVAGRIDASGASGSRIRLSASQPTADGDRGRLVLLAGSALLARTTQTADVQAGEVVLSTASADGQGPATSQAGSSIRAEAGSVIDVSGASAGQNGRVTFVAPRTDSGTDLAVSRLDAHVIGSRQTRLEGVRTYEASRISEQPDSATNLDATALGRMAREAGEFAARSDAIGQRLGRGDLTLTSGIEVRSSGDLQVSVNEQAFDASRRGWNLADWRFGGQAGTLTLRAAGDLRIEGSISDGFTSQGREGLAMPAWALSASPVSWSLVLTGGADLSSAERGRTRSGASGDVRIGFARPAQASSEQDRPVALVRTGTGAIEVNAARDIVLESTVLRDPDGDANFDRTFGAAIYTAGHALTLQPGFNAPQNLTASAWGAPRLTPAAFGTQGGRIDLLAGRDVQGVASAQLVNTWLFRQGRTELDKDGNAVFETLRLGNTPVGTLQTAWWTRHDQFGHGVATLAGGDLNVQAGRHVVDLSASVATSAHASGALVKDAVLQESEGGRLTVRAGGDIRGGQFYVQKGEGSLSAAGSIREGHQAVFDVLASTADLDVFTALKPIIALGDARISLTAGGDLGIETAYNPTLTRQSVHNVDGGLSLDSGLLLADNRSPQALQEKLRYAQFSQFSTYGDRSALSLTSVAGDVELSAQAALVALAGGADTGTAGHGEKVRPLYAFLPGTVKAAALGGSLTVAHGFAMAPAARGQLELLADRHVRIDPASAGVEGVQMIDVDPTTLSTASRPALLGQGGIDQLIRGGTGLAAHTPGGLHAGDDAPVRIVARQGDVEGRSGTRQTINLPKKAEIIAGRDIRDLGLGIQHLQADDRSLLSAGRDFIDSTDLDKSNEVRHVVTGPGLLEIQAGRHIDLGNSLGVVTRGNLDNPYLPEGGASIVAVAGARLPAGEEGLSAFERLKSHEALFSELALAARQKDLTDFDALIARVFPRESLSGGDIRVFGSQFKTEQDGAIDLLAPAGSVIAGVVSTPAYLRGRPASETGVFTVRGGAIRSLVRDDFQVNQGRVFSLGGGDITLVSQNGNIDAGRGTKTASSAPPPLLTTDANGNTALDISGSIAGSGIATLQTRDDQRPANVVAVAPRGIFDAGDAGVRSTGEVQIAAAVVLNAANIAASGGISSGASVDTGGLASAAPPPASSNATSAQDATARPATSSAKEALPLAVEVLGYGDAGASAPASDDEEDERRKKARGSRK